MSRYTDDPRQPRYSETGEEVEYVWNPYMYFPEDLFMVGGMIFAFYLMHKIFIVLITPISEYCVPEEPAPEDQIVPPSTTSTTTSSKDDSNTTLRQRAAAKKQQPQLMPVTPTTPLEPNSPTTGKPRRTKKKKSNRVRFQIAAWKCFSYTLSSIVGLYILGSDNWWLTPELYFKNWPYEHVVSFGLKFYYILGFGHYAYESLEILVNLNQTDLVAMIIHHIATLAVIFVSYIVNLMRVGAVILLLHDLSDPFMELAKCYLYSGRQKTADMLFALFALVFIVTRNYIFPYNVLYGIYLFAKHPDGRRVPWGRDDLFQFCCVCLIILACLHVYWGSLIVKMIYKAIVEKKVEDDVRELDDDDD
ncbi:Ceramide synthase 4 [Blyttiomyces sp. JEL0837]|nr:Ceramide synthase 4 [Blyttiomyces sp. JEL0837]